MTDVNSVGNSKVSTAPYEAWLQYEYDLGQALLLRIHEMSITSICHYRVDPLSLNMKNSMEAPTNQYDTLIKHEKKSLGGPITSRTRTLTQ